jgi:hypothetical protein
VGDSTRPIKVGDDDNDVDRKEFVGCGDVHSRAKNMTVGLITQLVQSLGGSNVRDTQTIESKYQSDHKSRALNTCAHSVELPRESLS